MKTVGIICEYNPFHLGHARQFQLIRDKFGSDTAIVCIMSGNYVQRGEPAMWNKFVRAKAAVACGADVVLELPITGVLQSAEGFARAGVECLTKFGGIDYLCFGAECSDSNKLLALAERMDGDAFQKNLRELLDTGLPYAAARQAAAQDQEEILRKPNNILGLEYCRAIKTCGSSMQPFVIHRNGDYHAETADQTEPSATAVRALYPSGNWKNYVPEPSAKILNNAIWYHTSYGERAVLARLRGLDDAEWERIAHGSEGLWSKAMKAARSCSDLEQIIQAIKSKRYPHTRIQRLLLCAYLGITYEDLNESIPYLRILSFSPTGRSLLRAAKTKEAIPLVNSGQTPSDQKYYRLETRVSDLFTLFAAPSFSCPCRMEQEARIF